MWDLYAPFSKGYKNGEIFHEPKASEISRHISQLTSVISALLFYTRYPHCSIFLYLARVITHVIKQLLSNALLRMRGTLKLTGKERVEEVYCSYWGLNFGLYAKQKALCGTGLSS